MSNCDFLIDDWILNKTVTGVNVDALYPAGRCVNGVPSQYTKSSTTSIQLTVDVTTAHAWNGIALINHTIPVGSTILVRMTDDPAFGSYTEVDCSAQWRLTNMYKLFGITCTTQYIRLIVSGASGVFQIGEWFAGTALVPDVNHTWNLRKGSQVMQSVHDFGGQIFKTVKARRREYGLQFRNVSELRYADYEKLIMQSYVVFIPDTGLLPCYHGVVKQDAIDSQQSAVSTGNIDNFDLVFTENAILPYV